MAGNLYWLSQIPFAQYAEVLLKMVFIVDIR